MARIILGQNEHIVIGGIGQVYGTAAGAETVEILSGDIQLDASFNRGGDTIVLGGAAGSYTAQVSGSTVLVTNGSLTVRIPVGPLGLDLSFGDATLALRYDVATNQVLLGAQILDGQPDPVAGSNQAPTVAAHIPDQDAQAGETWRYTVPRATFSDRDGDDLQVTARLVGGAALPAWLSFDTATRTFSGRPPAGTDMNLRISVTASDGRASVSDSFILDIEADNRPPRLADPIDDQSASEGAFWSFDVPAGTFRDPDGDRLTYSATLANGDPLPSWLSFDPATRSFSGSPDLGDAGTLDIRLTASDEDGAVASDEFSLNIGPVNAAPSIRFADGSSPVAVGGEALVNTATLSAQERPRIAALAGGNYVIIWQDYSEGQGGAGGDATGYAVKAQVFAPSGQRLGGEILVNTATLDSQFWPEVTPLDTGGFVVTWFDNSRYVDGQPQTGLKAQMFNANGAAAGAEVSITTATYSDEWLPVTAALDGGGFVVSWQGVSPASASTNGEDIWVRIVGADGVPVGSEVRVNVSGAGVQGQPQILALSDGVFMVTWTDRNDGDGSGSAIKARFFGPDGTGLGGEFLVNSAVAGDQADARITGLEDGRFVITWSDFSRSEGGAPGDASNGAVKAQLFGPGGARIGEEILVNSAVEGDQHGQEVTALAGGGFVIVWTDLSRGIGGATGDESGSAIKAQVFDADGARLGGEILVNSASEGGQDMFEVAALDDGGFVITWQDESGVGGDVDAHAIKAQLFGADGDPIGREIRANSVTAGDQFGPGIAGLAGGGFVVAWQDGSGMGGDTQLSAIKAQLFDRGFAVREGEAFDLTGIIQIDDDRTAGDISVMLEVTYGVIEVDAGTSGATASGSGTDAVTITGTLEEIQALLENEPAGDLSFVPGVGTLPPSSTLSVLVDDGTSSASQGLQIMLFDLP